MTNPQDIDQLRQRLRALGYLDAPVDRYVLGAASSRAGALRFALSASLRVGVIAGLLLGVSAAIALALHAPGFIASRRDAAVLAAALFVLFTVVTMAAVSATVLAASWFARRSPSLSATRARGIAAAAGIIVALASAAYLTLWWNSAQDIFTGLTFAWNAAAVAVAAAIALLLAHAVSVVILAALARSRESDQIAAGGLLSSRWFLVTFGVILLAGSAALLASEAGGGPRTTNAPPITVMPTGYALRVIAVDGVDAATLERMASQPGMRALPRLLHGTRVPFDRLSSGPPDPARDWTTIATGQPPQVHGIASLEARQALGIGGRLPAARQGITKSILDAADLLRLTTPAVASGEQRRAPAFWEVAAAAGLRTSVVNWWATWPAPEGDDIVFTDRAILRLDTGGELDAEIAPAALYEGLRSRWSEMRAQAAERARAAFAAITNADVRAVMQRSAELDILTAVLASVTPSAPLDLQVVYFAGLDIAQFQLLQGSRAGSVSAMSERVAAVETYYRFLDELIAPLVEPSRSHIDAVILWPGRTGEGEGWLGLSGGPIGDQRSVRMCTDCVVGPAPMLAQLLGLPLAEDLATWTADPVMEAFGPKFRVRTIPTWSAALTRARARTGQPLDAEALERLRSLGYIR